MIIPRYSISRRTKGKPVNGVPNFAKPDTNRSTNPTNPNGITVSGNPNPTNPTYPTNLTTKYRCELDIMCCLTWHKNLGPPFTGMPDKGFPP